MNQANRSVLSASDPSPPAMARTGRRGRLQARATLAIDGLPDALSTLAPGHAYAVYADPSPARETLFWQTAAAALRGPNTVLTARDATQAAATLRAHGLDIDVNGAVHGRANLCVLRPLPGRPGIEVLMEALRALADQCAARQSLIMVEAAEAFLDWDDDAALSRDGGRLAAWCAQHQLAVLLAITPPALPRERAPQIIARLHARFAGAAQLEQLHGQYTWEVAFWRDRDAVLASQSMPLRFSPLDQRLMVATHAQADAATPAGLLAPDEHRVIVCREAVAHERWIPDTWQLVDSNEAVVATAGSAVAATCIFHYAGNRDFETLAGQVHQLRRTCGSALKIVVREDQEAMRQHYELLLLNVGANLVIARRTSFARVQAMLESVQGQVFSRALPADYRTALSAVLTGSTVGYVPPAEFIDTVRAAVEQGQAIRLPHVLLRLPLLPEVAHVDALRACRLSRNGDICSADSDSVYVFFFACRLDDVDAVCRRVFTRPMDTLFLGELRCGDNDSIFAALDAFAADAAERELPDYRAWLATAAPEAGAMPAAAGNGPAVRDGAAPAVLPALVLEQLRAARARRNAPRARPQPNPLPLKSRG